MEFQGNFINFTNHPSEKWDISERKAAEVFGAIEDLHFPDISPTSGKEWIEAEADRYVELIASKNPSCVLCQGESGFTYHIVRRLKDRGLRCVAACTSRNVSETVQNGETMKNVVFRFIQFREY